MEYFVLFLFVVVIATVNIIFSIVLERFRRVFVFIPAFIVLSFSAYMFLSAQRIDDLAALSFVLFGFVFLFSGFISLIVAAVRYRPQAIK
jgi:predicted MFS family arabinose efflux permease